MKKFFMFAAAAMMILSAASCKKDSGNGDNNTAGAEVKTAKENLVVYLPLESEKDAIAVGKGISFEKKVGAAGFAKGMIGQAYTNTSGKNDEAYLKFKVAADNAFKTLDDITLTVWVKNVAEHYKGGLISLNGKNRSGDWPAFVAYMDNHDAATDDAPEKQQVNGRIVWPVTRIQDGNSVDTDSSLWMDTRDPAFAKYDKWFQFAFTFDHNSGEWALYVDGAQVKTAVYNDPDNPSPEFKKAINAIEGFNALYVGGWSAFIDGLNTYDWQSFFAGSIDEIRIFNKALSATEIDALYKEEVKVALAQ